MAVYLINRSRWTIISKVSWIDPPISGPISAHLEHNTDMIILS